MKKLILNYTRFLNKILTAMDLLQTLGGTQWLLSKENEAKIRLAKEHIYIAINILNKEEKNDKPL